MAKQMQKPQGYNATEKIRDKFEIGIFICYNFSDDAFFFNILRELEGDR